VRIDVPCIIPGIIPRLFCLTAQPWHAHPDSYGNFDPKLLFRKINQILHYITHFPKNFPIFLSRKEKKNHWVPVVFSFFSFLSFWCCWSGDHQKDSLAKFGYINYGSKNNSSILLYCWLPTGTLNIESSDFFKKLKFLFKFWQFGKQIHQKKLGVEVRIIHMPIY
jgi:hypothetical protein